MEILLCNLNDVNPDFKEELVKLELESPRIQNMIREQKWLIDEYREWNPEYGWETSLKTVALRVDRCWVDAEANMWGYIEILETVHGLLLTNNFPQNIAFVLKAFKKPELKNSKGEIVRKESISLVGFSYIRKKERKLNETLLKRLKLEKGIRKFYESNKSSEDYLGFILDMVTVMRIHGNVPWDDVGTIVDKVVGSKF